MTKILAVFFVVGVITLIAVIFSAVAPKKTMAESETTFWKYQCIDTMKISRDNARKWANKSDLQTHIDWEMKTIKGLGANCVAIDTPYDSEFMPYLTQWVNGARKQHLHVWFRGNFAGWEGWFNYPKITSNDVLLSKLQKFITDNQQLFQDGDIFTGAPEAENGGSYNQVEKNEYASFRAFLISQYNMEHATFAQIHKDVSVDWQSMNGGLAKRMLDQNTVDNTGGVVTIDHYIKNSSDMGGFVNYFDNKFKSKVVIGEFGAPIPDINGAMTEDQQATFVDKLMQELVTNRSKVVGINYWDLYDGSTALINPDESPRKVAAVIKKYYDPTIIQGTITDQLDKPIANASVKTDDGAAETVTDKNGNYFFPTAASSVTIIVNDGKDSTTATIQNIPTSQTIIKNIILLPKTMTFQQTAQLFIHNIMKGK